MPKFTKSGKPTAVGDVEAKLKAEYPDDPGAVYGTLNKVGLMHGNKTTAKGERAAKHPAGGLAVHHSVENTGILDVKHRRKF